MNAISNHAAVLITTLTHRVRNSYSVFSGKRGRLPQTVMIASCLGVKYLAFLNENPKKQEITNTHRVFNWLKKNPSSFFVGCRELPESMFLKLTIYSVADLIFSSLPNHTSHSKLNNYIKKETLFRLAVAGPFMEELFFRELIQGSLLSTMKLVNLLGSRINKRLTIEDKTIKTCSRVFSSVAFGLAHAGQDLTQAVLAGVNAYFYETWLYEKYGFFGSFGLHFANNSIVGLMVEMTKTRRNYAYTSS